MDNRSIKNNICKSRKEKKITQQQMAERLGISRNSYRKIESGNTVLVNDHVMHIANLLDKSPDEIVLGYSASEDSGKLLEEMNMEYARKIDELNGTISFLRERVRLLEDLVRTKDEIISMLKKK
ncbi:MAG: helix-turn-helix domain-containing protein [Bacteroidetes bacterium]|uniref:Helix-turn-helix domain-containing protein n=1 Tax=Candidatus Cryptobacteroides excrementipullorum TaxID=2840761 RepID=A0A9D9IWE4_9BACT|nr:helix-turn-helix domain-containing protein [Candidatus Cryptobacteroides excrementipullorum]